MNTQDIIQDYNRIYSTCGLRANSAYYRWIIKLLRLKSNTKFLDVCCGEGIFLREIVKLKRNIQTFGLDISYVALAKARENAPQARIISADGQRLAFGDNLFDYITCLGSLEHYLDPALGIRELARVAKPSAYLCIVLPNSISIDLVLNLIKTGEVKADNFQIIERTATKNDWVSLLHNNGLQVRATYGSNFWPELFQEGSFKIKSISKYFKRLLIKCFCPLNLAREFVFICEVREKIGNQIN